MSEVVDMLREEHKNFSKLLGILEREVDVFSRGEHPDYDIMEKVIEYFLGYPDSCHHPVEDLVYQKLAQQKPGLIIPIHDLLDEHQNIANLIRNFEASLGEAILDLELPRDSIVTSAKKFIEALRKHMHMEELYVFPLADDHLSKDDWIEIETELAYLEDPLFGPEVQRKYKSLHNLIMEFDDPSNE